MTKKFFLPQHATPEQEFDFFLPFDENGVFLNEAFQVRTLKKHFGQQLFYRNPYFVKHQDSWTRISHQFYQTPHWWWFIVLFNDVDNPLIQKPIPGQKLWIPRKEIITYLYEQLLIHRQNNSK